jgi:hypothetical protein
MSYESNIEDMANNVKSFASSNIDTYLTGITATKGDGITLESFREFVLDEGDSFSRTMLPSCMVNPEQVKSKVLTLGSDQIELMLSFTLIMSVGRTSKNVTIMLRYVEAFRQLFRDDPTCGGVVDSNHADIEIAMIREVNDKKMAIITATFFKEIANN